MMTIMNFSEDFLPNEVSRNQDQIDTGSLQSHIVESIEEVEHTINKILVKWTNNCRMILIFERQFETLSSNLENTKNILVGLNLIVAGPTKKPTQFSLRGRRFWRLN